MRQVQPRTYLIAVPQLLHDQVLQYLRDIGVDDDSGAFDRLARLGDGEALVEFGGRLCYRSWEPGLNANVTKVREDSRAYLGNILASGHGSVLEHANFSFVFQDVSRIFTHEFVRHRAGVAISQESMRYVRLTDLPFWFPSWALDDPQLMSRLMHHLADAEQLQVWLAQYFQLDNPETPFHEKKHRTSFMRRFAPSGHATALLATINVRSLRHIIGMRTDLAAEEEIRIVCDQMAELALAELPNLMQDYTRDENAAWVPEFMKV